MLIETHQTKAWLIGDPHFGRNFSNGTPLHRRGDREKMQRAQFQEELATPDVGMVVMKGDLFDKPFVPLQVLSQVINDVVDAAQSRPDVEFVYEAGNHDLSRQLNSHGAWQIFDLAVSWLPNVTVVNEPVQIKDLAFFPWQWDVDALTQVENFKQDGPITAALGHWDLKDFGGDTSHMAPTKTIRERLGSDIEFYSGHYHEEGVFPVDGIDVHCTGSMQPYAHGEGDMYVTLTPEEALARDDLHDKCVRILLEPGEMMPEIDCLQLTRKAADAQDDVEEIELGAVAAQSFNVSETLNRELAEAELPDEVTHFIKEALGDFA